MSEKKKELCSFNFYFGELIRMTCQNDLVFRETDSEAIQDTIDSSSHDKAPCHVS